MKSRLTKLRREILGVIERAERPLNAKTIRHRTSSKPDLSTIYRALDFLTMKRLIHTVSFSGIRYFFIGKKGHGHFLICKECHEIQEFDDCVVASLQKKIQNKYNYSITDHVLYFEGLCAECQQHVSKKRKFDP
jgi:Fur family ferric uptake transcriptional regulator